MTDIDLLPCPFCGGTEIYIGPMNRPSAWGDWEAGCNNDDCPLDVDSVKVEGGTLEKAAAAWNTRATDANLAALQAEIERLRAEVEGLREQLRLSTVDQATAEAEANDARAKVEALSTDLRAMRAERERAMEARQLISDDLA